MAKLDLNLSTHETYRAVVRLTEANGWPSLSGATALAQIRRVKDNALKATFTTTVREVDGEIDLELDPDDTDGLDKFPDLVWDLRVAWADDVRYPVSGAVTFRKAVSVPA